MLMTPAEFVLSRDRDAYATIRGYVYQVDLTLCRWIDLTENQHLEVECGEDIDLVTLSINATSTDEAARFLEQVKHRAHDISLRNPAALEALSNAIEHRSANPKLELRFCFTTNASITTERPCPFPNKTAGINLWEQIRRGQLKGALLSKAKKSLSQFLSKSLRPNSVDKEQWESFQTAISEPSLSSFTDLISRFEWSTSNPGALSVSLDLRDLLVQRGFAAAPAEADQLYQRLFLYVFKRLCQEGRKLLTRDELKVQLSAQTISNSDHSILNRLNECFRFLEKRVDQVESAVAAVTDGLHQLVLMTGINATLLQGPQSIDLALPPLNVQISLRTDTVNRLEGIFSKLVWAAIWGASDTGKSQLALLLVKQGGNCVGWVRFGNSMASEEASGILDRALESLGGSTRPESAMNLYQRACGRIGAGRVIVLDDLPRMHGDDPLVQRLALLGEICRETGTHLLSTSQHPLPSRLRSGLGPAVIEELAAPMLTESETSDTLAAHGAPNDLLVESAVRMIHTLTEGHPLLVSLASEYLREKCWKFEADEISGLLKGEHTGLIADEILDRIVTSLSAPPRELLYRLTLPTGAFMFDVVRAVSDVSPVIEQPREQLNRLLGAWVQRDAERQFVVSPLVRTIGSENISQTTRTACHSALAQLIVSQEMTIYQAHAAIIHFVQAESFDRAGSLFLFLLEQARTLKSGLDIGPLRMMWSSTRLPDGMSLGVKLAARSLQLAVLPKYHCPIDFVLADLDRLLASNTESPGWAVLMVGVFASFALIDSDPDRALKYVSLALRQSDFHGPDGAILTLSEGRQFEEVLWFAVPGLKTAERLSKWITILEQLPKERRQAFLKQEDALLGCVVLASRLWVAEAEKSAGEQNWEMVLAAIHDLKARAKALEEGVLEAAAIRSLLAVYGEYVHNLQPAIAIATEALDRLAAVPAARFLIAGMLARQYVFAQRIDEARPVIALACEQAVTEFPHEMMLNLLCASRCFGAIDVNRAVEYAAEAVRLARSDERIPVIEAARAGAELTTAIFLRSASQDGAIAAFAQWSDTASWLVGCQDDSDEWKDLFVVFLHQTGFLTSMAASGRSPETVDSGEKYTAPSRGVFLRSSPERLEYYSSSHLSALMWLLYQYAEAAGDSRSAAYWLGQVSTHTDPAVLRWVEASAGRDSIPHLVTACRFSDAIDAALRYCHAVIVFNTDPVPTIAVLRAYPKTGLPVNVYLCEICAT